jgi:PAS domain S-box-containing protein
VDAAARLQALLANAPIIHFAFDKDGIIEADEGGAIALLGRRPGELTGRSIYDVFAHVPALLDNFRRALGGESFRDVVELGGLWFSVQYVPIFDTNGAVEGVVGFASDVSEQRRRECALAESEERYRQLAEAAFEAIAITDQGRIVDANGCLAQMFGYELPELIGKSALEMTAPESRSTVLARILEGYEGAYEAIGMRKDGSTFIGEIRGRNSHYQGRQVRITAIRDNTERAELLAKEQSARATAEEALRIRDEFMSIAAHELNSPLTSLRVRVEQVVAMARGEHVDRARLGELADICLRQAHRLSFLVRDLLDVARIRAGQLMVDLGEVDLVEIVCDVVGRMSDELVRARCAVELRADAAVVGQWDRLRLEQVVVNLLTNAIKYGTGRPIRISVDGDGASARLVVADHGIGIAPELQPRVFDRFERGAVRTQKVSGLGLGLYIVRRIVEAHGGRVAVESQPGQGSRFVVELPR